MIIEWRKAARSEAHGNCVELAALPHAIAIRDSKAPAVGHLLLTPKAMAKLLAQAKRGELPS